MDGRATRTPAGPERAARSGAAAVRRPLRSQGTDGTDDRFRHSYSKDRAQLLRRLSRIEGQVRGIGRMIERDEYCIDILQQTAALRAAIDSLGLLVMEDHVAGCLQTAARTGDAEAYTEELMDVVRRTLGRPVRSSRQTTSD
jgi:DNA-binding FrmR family transcriptional regulator